MSSSARSGTGGGGDARAGPNSGGLAEVSLVSGLDRAAAAPEPGVGLGSVGLAGGRGGGATDAEVMAATLAARFEQFLGRVVDTFNARLGALEQASGRTDVAGRASVLAGEHEMRGGGGGGEEGGSAAVHTPSTVAAAVVPPSRGGGWRATPPDGEGPVMDWRCSLDVVKRGWEYEGTDGVEAGAPLLTKAEREYADKPTFRQALVEAFERDNPQPLVDQLDACPHQGLRRAHVSQVLAGGLLRRVDAEMRLLVGAGWERVFGLADTASLRSAAALDTADQMGDFVQGHMHRAFGRGGQTGAQLAVEQGARAAGLAEEARRLRQGVGYSHHTRRAVAEGLLGPLFYAHYLATHCDGDEDLGGTLRAPFDAGTEMLQLLSGMATVSSPQQWRAATRVGPGLVESLTAVCRVSARPGGVPSAAAFAGPGAAPPSGGAGAGGGAGQWGGGGVTVGVTGGAAAVTGGAAYGASGYGGGGGGYKKGSNRHGGRGQGGGPGAPATPTPLAPSTTLPGAPYVAPASAPSTVLASVPAAAAGGAGGAGAGKPSGVGKPFVAMGGAGAAHVAADGAGAGRLHVNSWYAPAASGTGTQPVAVLADTGATCTLVSRSAAARLGLVPKGATRPVVGVGGAVATLGAVTLHLQPTPQQPLVEVRAEVTEMAAGLDLLLGLNGSSIEPGQQQVYAWLQQQAEAVQRVDERLVVEPGVAVGAAFTAAVAPRAEVEPSPLHAALEEPSVMEPVPAIGVEEVWGAAAALDAGGAAGEVLRASAVAPAELLQHMGDDPAAHARLAHEDAAGTCDVSHLPPPVSGQERADQARMALGKAAGVIRVGGGIPAGVMVALVALLAVFAGLFRGDLSTPVTGALFDIRLREGTTAPFVRGGTHLPPSQVAALLVETDAMVEMGVAEYLPAGTPVEYAMPYHLVPKPDGGRRLVLNAQGLNAVTERQYPATVPDTNALLASLQNGGGRGKLITTIDCYKGFWQIATSERVSQFATIVMPPSAGAARRYLRMKRMPMGVMEAPDAFQAVMSAMFRELIDDGLVVVYLDDLLVVTDDDWALHLSVLERVFAIARTYNLQLNPRKTVIGCTGVTYLGHRVTATTRSADAAKVETVKEWPRPTTLVELRAFLGFVGFLRMYCPPMEEHLGVLYELTAPKTMVARRWGERQEAAFLGVKAGVAACETLWVPVVGREFMLHTDASGSGVGYVLTQADDGGTTRPVAFGSRALTPREVACPVGVREVIAISWSLAHCRHLIGGQRVHVYTDHRNLLHGTQSINPIVQHHLINMSVFDVHIHNVAGRDNPVADTLSRYSFTPFAPGEVVEEVTSTVEDLLVRLAAGQVFLVAGAGDAPTPRPDRFAVLSGGATGGLEGMPLMLGVVQAAQRDAVATGALDGDAAYDVMQRGGVWLVSYKGSVWIPPANRQLTMAAAHDARSHPSFRQTLAHLQRANVSWETMGEDVEAFVAACPACQRLAKRDVTRPQALLQAPVEPPPRAFLLLDVFGPYALLDGSKVPVLGIMDWATRYVELIAMERATAESVMGVLEYEWLLRHGVPVWVQSDNGPCFVAEAFRTGLTRFGVRHHLSTPYHPESNARLERVNLPVAQAIRAVAPKSAAALRELMRRVSWELNTHVNGSIGVSPFEAFFGERAVDDLCAAFGVWLPPAGGKLRDVVEAARVLVAARSAEAFEAVKRRHDKRAVELELAVGDHVLVWHPPRRKGETEWRGPWQVVGRHAGSAVTWDLRNPETGSIEVRHVNHLRVMDMERTTVADEMARELPEGWFLVDHVVSHAGRGKTLRFIVRWSGYGPEHDSALKATDPAVQRMAAVRAYCETHALRLPAPVREEDGESESE